jgi:hypothetical protein
MKEREEREEMSERRGKGERIPAISFTLLRWTTRMHRDRQHSGTSSLLESLA